MGKASWITYLYERSTGLEPRPLNGSFSTTLPASRDRQHFPGAYAELDRLERDALVRIRDARIPDNAKRAGRGGVGVHRPDGLRPDRDRPRPRQRQGRPGRPRQGHQRGVPAGGRARLGLLAADEHYATDEEFVYALADVLHEEYRAIVESGAFLQVDDAVLMHEADTMASRGQSYEEYRAWARLRVEALNHALRGLPEDRIRYHVCFGSWHGPHAYDPPLRDSIDLVLAVQAKYYLIEQANPRHEHEWKIWQDVTLPDGKVLVPGVVTHHTNVVEHPELVAQRLVRLANVVGRDRVMAGTDCGFAQGAFMHRVHEEIQWAKLAALVEGARIASRELWGAKPGS